MNYRIEEGMTVYDTNGEKVGKVGEVVVGGRTRETRLFTIEKGLLFTKDYLVPRENIVRVEGDKAFVSLTKDQVQRLPEYHARPPSRDEVNKAYEIAGGRRGTEPDAYSFEGEHFGVERGGTPYAVFIEEEYLIVPREERERGGYRSDWEYGTGVGRRGTEDRTERRL